MLTAGTTYAPAQVIQHCAERLEPFMVPKWVTCRSSIPKTPSGRNKTNIWDHATVARVGGDEV